MKSSDQKLIALYQKTRLQQPSTLLDDKILNAAQNKLTARQKKPKKILWALSSVAILVLSVNVALKLLVVPTATQAPYPPTMQEEELAPQINETFEMPETKPSTSLMREIEQDVRQQLKKKAIQKNETTKSQKLKRSMPKKLLRSAPPASQSIESMSFSDALLPLNSLPIFSFNVEELRHLYPTLTIRKSHQNTIKIYSHRTLILMLNHFSNNAIDVTAYPQSNELKLDIEWDLKSNALLECSVIKHFKLCSINQKQTGYFNKDGLAKVTWIQQSGDN